jgi:hypothetical protein
MIELLLIIEGIMHEKRRGNFPTYQPNLNQKRTKQPAKFKVPMGYEQIPFSVAPDCSIHKHAAICITDSHKHTNMY